jgi:hypothetical protein
MAVTAQKSTQVGKMEATPLTALKPDELHGRLRIAYFNFTQDGAGDANSTVDLVKLPPNARLLKSSSVLTHSAFGASRTLDIGYTAYNTQAGTAVVAAIDVIMDGLDVSAAGANVTLGVGTNADNIPTIDLNNRDFVVLQAKVLGGTIPNGATLEGYIPYVVD